MAHKSEKSEDGEADDVSKRTLNRREYVKLGAAATTVALGLGSGVSVSASESGTSYSYATGFGNYA